MKEAITAVQAMQNFIETHLEEKIELTDLATACGYSPWYAAKLFKKLVGLSPSDYIRRLRLARSALLLRDEACKITDLAFRMGFESVDGYQRAFMREFGCNPKEYAQKPRPLSLYVSYGVKFKELWKENNKMEKTNNIFIQLVEKQPRKVIIKRGIKADEYWEYCQEVGCDVWGVLTSIKSLNGEPVCLWLPQKYVPAGTSVYVQGAEVPADYSGEVPEGFDIIELPAAKYLMFQGAPFNEEDYCEAIESLKNAIASYNPSVIGFKWDKENPRIQLEPVGERGYIELLPVV